VSCPRAQQANLPACSLHFSLILNVKQESSAVISAVGAGDAAASPNKNFLGKIWENLVGFGQN